ncbi:hypothetical protein GJ744_009456 [Endocarpon pusillum]|uniref:Uncharacterized protein n=1 Tax=Endocarpon pusillum TaxID=364733 RepID=A0A8H7AJS2_9EURO|nr:hypothetical protein GJ744_009456 [Endocarpon pusillum]
MKSSSYLDNVPHADNVADSSLSFHLKLYEWTWRPFDRRRMMAVDCGELRNKGSLGSITSKLGFLALSPPGNIAEILMETLHYRLH